MKIFRRLTTIPGVGAIRRFGEGFPPDFASFVSGRHFAAWLGLTPKPHSSGGKERLGGISKMGNPMLRSLLVLGAASVLRHVKNNADGPQWLIALVARTLQDRRNRAGQQNGWRLMGAADQRRRLSQDRRVNQYGLRLKGRSQRASRRKPGGGVRRIRRMTKSRGETRCG